MAGIASFDFIILRTEAGRRWAHEVIARDHRVRQDVHEWIEFAIEEPREFDVFVHGLGTLRDVFLEIVSVLDSDRLIAEYPALLQSAQRFGGSAPPPRRAPPSVGEWASGYGALASLLRGEQHPAIILETADAGFVPAVIGVLDGIRGAPAKLAAYADPLNGRILLGTREDISHIGLALLLHRGFDGASPPMLKAALFDRRGEPSRDIDLVLIRIGPFGETVDDDAWLAAGRHMADAFVPNTVMAEVHQEVAEVAIGAGAAVGGVAYPFLRSFPADEETRALRVSVEREAASFLGVREARGLMRLADRFRKDGTKLFLKRGGEEVEVGPAIVSLLTLRIVAGTWVELIAVGPSAEEVIREALRIPPFVREGDPSGGTEGRRSGRAEAGAGASPATGTGAGGTGAFGGVVITARLLGRSRVRSFSRRGSLRRLRWAPRWESVL